MRELTVTIAQLHVPALDQALKTALGSVCPGLSTYGPDRPISVWLDDSASPDDFATAEAIAAAHDPVFLSADKTRIEADGIDTASLTVLAQNSVNLLVEGVSVPVTLINGLGTLQITSDDPASITITVENPANRSTDSITIEAL